MNVLSLVGLGFSIFIAIVNVVALIAIKFNDLKHVQKSLDKIENKIDDMDKRMDCVGERVAKIEGRLK